MKKINYLYLGALALPLMFTACNNEDIEAPSKNAFDNAQVVELSDNFQLFAARGGEGVASRAEWLNGTKLSMYWMPRELQADIAIDDAAMESEGGFTLTVDPTSKEYAFDKVGLAWVGAQGAETNIYSNYEFTHSGWLAVGNTTDMKHQVVECVDGKYYYNWDYVLFNDLGSNDIKVTSKAAGTGYYAHGELTTPVNASTLGISTPKTIDELNLSNGTFATENKSIFSGNYIAYYPYNAELVEAAPLRASINYPINFVVGDDNRMVSAGKYTFACGYMDTPIEGGVEASSLKMSSYTGFLALQIADGSMQNIKKMILFNKDGKIVQAADLTASDIKNKTFANAVPAKKVNNVEINFTDKSGAAANLLFDYAVPADDSYARLVIPMMPAEIDELYVILVDDKEIGYMNKLTNVSIKSNQIATCTGSTGGYIKMNLTKSGYIATDHATLDAAVANATGTTDKVQLLGDIMIDEPCTIEDVTITGEFTSNGSTAKVGRLVVTGSDNATQNVLTLTDVDLTADMLIEAQGCCHNFAGKLIAENLKYNKGLAPEVATITNNGEIEFTATSAKATNYIYGNINNNPWKYVAGAVDAAGEEYLLSFETEKATIALEEKATVKVFGVVTNNYSTTTTGKRVDGEISLASMTTGVDGDDATLIIDYSTAAQGKLINNATVLNRGNVVNNTESYANIENNTLATFVNMIGGQLNGMKLKKVANSNFISEVDNAIDSRYATALADGLTNIIRIEELNSQYASNANAMVFPMKGINNKDLKYVINTENVTLVGTVSEDATTAVPATIGALELTANATGFYLNRATAEGQAVNLVIDQTSYNATHVADAVVPVNDLYPVAIPAVMVGEGSVMNVNSNKNEAEVTLKVIGDFNTLSTTNFGAADNTPILVQEGNLNVKKSTFTFAEKVIKSKVLGNFNIETGANVQVKNDVKIKFYGTAPAGKVTNKGTCNIASATSMKAAAVIFCNDYDRTNGTWTNGRPTPFTAGGITESDYNW